MAGRGPAPTGQAQKKGKKPGSAVLTAPSQKRAPKIPNPDGREWCELTREWWKHVWASPMASQYLETDVDELGRVAVLVDDFNRLGSEDSRLRLEILKEIRYQEARFGLSPVDRSRLQWEVHKAEQVERKSAPRHNPSADPRDYLEVVEGGKR